MLLILCISMLVLHAMAVEEVAMAKKAMGMVKKDMSADTRAEAGLAVEGRSLGYGFGYNNYGGHGNSYGYGHGGRHHQNVVPINIPFIDRNGCRAPGDVVCASDDGADRTQYGLCILSDESKSLWKKPSMQIVDVDCVAGTQTLTDWCNDNERLLRASGLVHDKDAHHHVYRHQKKFVFQLNPCILTT